MSLHKKAREIKRLFEAFEAEAAKFHDLDLSTYFFTQTELPAKRKFREPNHAVVLWQYYGQIPRGEEGSSQLLQVLDNSDLQWGIRGAELTSYAVLEGEGCDLFVRMAKRAGGIFSGKDAEKIKTRLIDELHLGIGGNDTDAVNVFSTNSHPLSVWINFLLFHLSKTDPRREKEERIEPDPFTLSMLALERLIETPEIIKSDRSASDVEQHHFRVAISFPGNKRLLVSEVVGILRSKLGSDTIFYDFDYQAQLARPNLDILLQDIYRNRSDLIVVFLAEEYSSREWCGLEWRAIRDIIKAREDRRVMLVKCDESTIDGIFSIDGFVDARRSSPKQIAKYVIERLSILDD